MIFTTFPIEDYETSITEIPANTGFASQFTGNIYTSRGRFGNGTNYWDISATEMKTANFVSGSTGCRIGYNGNVEFNDGVFRGNITGATGTFSGTLSAAAGTIGGWTISAAALYYDGATAAVSSGMASADYPFYAGKKYADRATAPFRVTPAGALVATSATITGALTAGAGSSISGAYISNINADTITAGTITGRTVRTAASGARVVLDSTNYLQAYDASYLRVKLDTTELHFWNEAGEDRGYLRGVSSYIALVGTRAVEIKSAEDYTLLLHSGVFGGAISINNNGTFVNSKGLLPDSNNTTPLGSSSVRFSNVYSTSGNFSGDVSIGTLYVGHVVPHATNTYNLGSDVRKWNWIFRSNEGACELPTSNSAIDIIKKISKPEIKEGEYGERHYFEDKDFPEEMKAKTPSGKIEIEFTRTTGVLVQAVRELTKRLEVLESKK